MSKTLADIFLFHTGSHDYTTILNFLQTYNPIVNKGINCHGYISADMKCPEYVVVALKINKRGKQPYVVVHGIAGIYLGDDCYNCIVVCTKGIGSKIIDAILNQAILQQIQTVNVNVFPDYIKYYRKFNFANTPKTYRCNQKMYGVCQGQMFQFLSGLLSAQDVRRTNCTSSRVTEKTFPLTWINPYFRR